MHAPLEKVHRKRLPQLRRRKPLCRRQQPADVVFVDMSDDHAVDMPDFGGLQIFQQRLAAGGAVRIFLRLAAAAVDHHDEPAVPAVGVRALHYNGLPVAHIYKGQITCFHKQLI